MEIQPLHDRLVVKRIEAKEIVKGGIVIPDTAREKPQSGVVMAIGKGKILENGTRIEMTVKEGDQILFAKYSGTEIKLDGEVEWRTPCMLRVRLSKKVSSQAAALLLSAPFPPCPN